MHILPSRRSLLLVTAAIAAAFVLAAGAITPAGAIAPAAASAPAGAIAPAGASASVPTPPPVEWSVAPADTEGPDGRISLRHALDPGSSVTDAIAVTNTGAADATFDVRAGDGLIGAGGAFDIAPGDSVDSGSWIAVDGLDGGSLTLAPGDTRVLPLTVTVPADATPGDHPAAIVVGISQDSDDGVTVRHRIGVRLHLQVRGDIVPALEVADVATSYVGELNPFAPGVLRVEYTVRNTGNVRLGAADTANAAGPFGWAPGSAAADAASEFLPGFEAARVQEIVVPPLIWLTGELVVTPVAIGEDQVTAPAPIVVEVSAWAPPWSAFAMIVLLAGVVVLVVWLIRRARRRARERTRAQIDAAVALAREEAARESVGAH